MTEERAALLIAEYANGLRRELALLGASETNDLVSEIVSLLRDASMGDADAAATEIDRLGPPEQLARTVLEQHGLETGPGLQAASWWRLGIAAPLDIAVGLAAPVAASALAWRASLSPAAEAGSSLADSLWVPLSWVVVAATLWLAWRYWRPWRVGGREATAGMTLAGIAVVTLGGSRTVVTARQLSDAGLARPHRSRIGSALTVAFAAALLVWAVVAIGAPVSADGARGVEAYAGEPTTQMRAARAAVEQTYTDAFDTSYGDAPSGADAIASGLRRRALSGELKAYRLVAMTELGPGAWAADVAEDVTGGTRAVTVTVSLRVTWSPEGHTTPEWIVTGYAPTGSTD